MVQTGGTLLVISDIQEALTKEWTGLNAIIEIEYERAVVASARIEKEKRYYISSLQPDAQQLATYIRNHWGNSISPNPLQVRSPLGMPFGICENLPHQHLAVSVVNSHF